MDSLSNTASPVPHTIRSYQDLLDLIAHMAHCMPLYEPGSTIEQLTLQNENLKQRSEYVKLLIQLMGSFAATSEHWNCTVQGAEHRGCTAQGADDNANANNDKILADATSAIVAANNALIADNAKLSTDNAELVTANANDKVIADAKIARMQIIIDDNAKMFNEKLAEAKLASDKAITDVRVVTANAITAAKMEAEVERQAERVQRAAKVAEAKVKATANVVQDEAAKRKAAQKAVVDANAMPRVVTAASILRETFADEVQQCVDWLTGRIDAEKTIAEHMSAYTSNRGNKQINISVW